MIDTREELLIALTEACELEHSLACQYLYAAFSMKDKTFDTGITPAQRQKITGWKRKILRIAKEEMEHLATVTNLLNAVGGAPHFRRPNFPQPANFYPPNIPFWLERFSVESLKRFVEFERHADAPALEMAPVVPEELMYKHVGELYNEIREGFATIEPAVLFLNPDAQDITFTGQYIEPQKAVNREQALEAIDAITKEGEAFGQGEYSHYEVFKEEIGEQLKLEIEQNPGFDPSRPVITNPLTRRHRDTAGDTLITDMDTRQVAELFNALYTTMILAFQQYYAFGGENDDQRIVLQGTLLDFMISVIRPLGEILTQLPAGPDYPNQTAGAPFEFYGVYRLSTRPRVAWKVIHEKLALEAAEAERLAQKPGAHQGLGGIHATVEHLRASINAALPSLP